MIDIDIHEMPDHFVGESEVFPLSRTEELETSSCRS